MATLPDCMMPDGGDPCEGFTQLRAEIERLREEVAMWKERWEAERADHKATIKHCDETMRERDY